MSTGFGSVNDGMQPQKDEIIYGWLSNINIV